MSIKPVTLLALAALAACAPDTPSITSFDGATRTALQAHYIVMLRPAAAPRLGAGVSATRLAPGEVSTALARTTTLASRMHGAVSYTYGAAVDGFAATLPDSAVAALRADPAVLSVEPDGVVQDDGTETGAPWGLDRIDQVALPLSASYTFANAGAGVSVYMIDHGISFTNVDFGGRAVTGYDAITPGGNAADCTGHGTETASIAGGSRFGVAKGVRLVAVRVEPCTGQPGSFSAILAGIDWVTSQKQANPSKPMVASMSFHGGISAAADTAVVRMVRAGVVVAVSAGNGGVDACTVWPAHLPAVITVGGSDNTDTFWSNSNRGPCVDLVAPAVSVPAAINTGSTSTLFSGTSAATPHAAGAAALYLAAHPASTPAQVQAALVANATVGKLKAVPANTANRLLNVAFITAAATNQPPNAMLSAPAYGSSFAQGTSVTFTGSGLDTEDGALSGASLAWVSSVNGPLGTGASATTSALSVGRHTITLTATDSKGAKGVATILVTITTASTTNHPPTAAITAPASGATFASGASITFAGSGSDAEDGTLGGASLVWMSSIDGQIGTGASFSTSTLSAGTHTITLTAKDSKGATAAATRSISITSQSPSGGAASAGFTFSCGTVSHNKRQCPFDGRTSTSTGSSIATYAFDWGDGTASTVVTSPQTTTTHSFVNAGTYMVMLTATDKLGRSAATSKPVTVP